MDMLSISLVPASDYIASYKWCAEKKMDGKGSEQNHWSNDKKGHAKKHIFSKIHKMHVK